MSKNFNVEAVAGRPILVDGERIGIGETFTCRDESIITAGSAHPVSGDGEIADPDLSGGQVGVGDSLFELLLDWYTADPEQKIKGRWTKAKFPSVKAVEKALERDVTSEEVKNA